MIHIHASYHWYCGGKGTQSTNADYVDCPDCLKDKPLPTDGFHFPRAKFADELPNDEQFLHVAQEYHEFRDEDIGTDAELIEAWDLLHSVETWLRIREREGADVHAAKIAVFEKNNKRGYYNR